MVKIPSSVIAFLDALRSLAGEHEIYINLDNEGLTIDPEDGNGIKISSLEIVGGENISFGIKPPNPMVKQYSIDEDGKLRR